jgi:hypothetical protein
MSYSTNLQIVLEDIAQEYRTKIEQSIRSVISQPKYKASGAGVASLTVTVIDGNAQRSPSIQVNIDDHIFRLESRNLQWTELPNMRKMLEWASYKKSDPKEARTLAWSVAKHKQKTDTWKPKTWRRKSLSAVLKEMNKDMLQRMDEAIAKDFEKSAQGVQV